MLPGSLNNIEKARKKKSILGSDIDISTFVDEDIEYESINKMDEVGKSTKRTLKNVGIDTDETGRAGSFLQIDKSNVYSKSSNKSIELMSMKSALEKHSWLKDYMWKAVNPETDKYTAETYIQGQKDGTSGYFIRSAPGSKESFPIQSCMFIGDNQLMQTVHNIIIAEENSEINIITGCATGEDVSSALHLGITEVYLKPGSKVSFTMIHNWAEQVEVRPRTGVICEDNSTYINNYILTSPVKSIQTCPTINCLGKNVNVLSQSILGGVKDSVLDTGAHILLNGAKSKAEVASRAVSKDNSKIYARGNVEGLTPDVKGHVECDGLILSNESMIKAVPVLKASATDLELSHEAAVGKISEEEIRYLTSRGLTEEEAASMIVRGFLSMDIEGLPEELAAETKKMVDLSLKGI